ncbi:L,D-transpeptidase family protein [Nocardioides sp. KIGAM211]|uniref:L,D-transpeptidase family protein n=1 Tax=Nocardioides luti TaxID=2761101 RepID=A0A7X0V9T6_9ACTN|nr:L,D-transpeptidase family protein [Nocardioides luti]
MKRLLPLLLLATALVTGPLPASVAAPAPAAAATTELVRLDGVTVRLKPRTTQVVTVNHTRGHHARVTFWALSHGEWVARFRAVDGRIGYAGLVAPTERVQGSGKTPLGTHRLPWAFGTHARRDGWETSYRRIGRDDYWVLDNASDHYNEWRSRRQGGFRWRLPASDPNASEHLRDYPQQYEYAVTTSFNHTQVRHRGGAIFLHVNGRGATAGCVSAPRWFLRRLLGRLDADRVPVIAIGR